MSCGRFVVMPLETKPLSKLEEADLQELIDNEVREGKTIDYKRQVGDSREDKKEFCRDVLSFANDSGGHLIIGIEEDQGLPKRLSGLDVSNPDAEISRLEQIIMSGIEPKIPGLRTTYVKLNRPTLSGVIIIRIPKSLALPHRITAHDVFYARSSSGKYALDILQIRNLFSSSDTAVERLRNFRSKRIENIVSGNLPIGDFGIINYPKTIIHILPLSMANPSVKCDLTQFDKYPERLDSIRAGDQRFRYNFDGLLVYATNRNTPQYTQVFHNGAIEALWTQYMMPADVGTNIPISSFQQNIVSAVRNFLRVEKYYLGIEPPFYITMTIIDIKGFGLALDHSKFPSGEVPSGNPIDRPTLVFPETMIDSFESDVVKAMKSIFDSLWNAAGLPESKYLPE
jgi:hypothetical protein